MYTIFKLYKIFCLFTINNTASFRFIDNYKIKLRDQIRKMCIKIKRYIKYRFRKSIKISREN